MLVDAQTPRDSKHAQRRRCQRCISEGDVEIIRRVGERVRDVGDGAVEISIARGQWAELREMGLAPTRIEHLMRIVIVDASDGTSVTVMKEEWFARRSRGLARLSCRERAVRAARRKRGRINSCRNRR